VKIAPLITRHVSKIYLQASNEADSLARKCDELMLEVIDPQDLDHLSGNVAFCKRFRDKARTAAERSMTIMDDGALRDYCEKFDKVFLQFVKFAETCEKDLNVISEKITKLQ